VGTTIATNRETKTIKKQELRTTEVGDPKINP
jgi:hypothetical protein